MLKNNIRHSIAQAQPQQGYYKMTQNKKDIATEEVTPMMKQFFSLKAKHPDAILLFRCGDFYETYHKDAEEASQLLGITLTHRSSKGAQGGVAMAGFPYHALDTYLPRLVRAGRRVAICDQLEDPKLTRKLVKRGITELVTPGIAMSDTVLQGKENNFLAAIDFGRATCGLAFLDISTGEFLTAEGTYEHSVKLMENFQPKEVVYCRNCREQYAQHFDTKICTYEMEEWAFNYQTARQRLLRHFGVKTLKGFGVDHLHSGLTAAGAILQYLELTQHTRLGHITHIARIEEERFVRIDKFTMRSIELLQPMHEGGLALVDVIDNTLTPMGGRTLRRWISFPLKEPSQIEKRLDTVDYFFRHPDFRETAEYNLCQIGDLERLVSKIATGRISPRESVQLRLSLEAIEPVKRACLAADSDRLKTFGDRLNLCTQLHSRIAKELRDDAPSVTSRGGFIRPGFNSELDALRDISTGGRQYLMELQQREIEKTGIASLKIGFNNVFGYYLEVRNSYKDRVPTTWVRKQTLAQAERYVTEELKEYEEKITGADEKILQMEMELYSSLVQDMQEYVGALQINAQLIAQIDCLLSFAKTAETRHYVRPQITSDTVLDIRAGRHPVIETQMEAGERYVPNDVHLDSESQQIIILTGPNMAGKSALLRQTALIVLLAQIGSYVPADSASIGVVDKIFTRVGASDNISMGESTFMVEMTEAADIMNNATPRSLVLFDELGRGTSTYDGISIAWAIVEYLHEEKAHAARTLFATHYHELNEMERQFSRVKNYNVSVREVNGQVVFLRKLVPGGSEHSFGLHVAQMAGMPPQIVSRAEDILHQLEANNQMNGMERPQTEEIRKKSDKGIELSFYQLDDPVLCQIRDQIIDLDINSLTPIEALNKLNEIKKILKP